MKKLTVVIGSLGLLIGCVTGSAVSSFVAPKVRAGTNPQRWEYHCENDLRRAWNPGELSRLNALGKEGWEMVQQLVGINSSNGDVFCFKRPL